MVIGGGWLVPGCDAARRTGSPGRPGQPTPLSRAVRAVWVARFHYHTPDDVRTIIRNCAGLGFNTVLWQVRGNGTVMYPSRIEPWAEAYGYKHPGYDPLRVAVDEAHRYGLRIEAWVNVMPGWRGPDAPPIRDQLWHTHPAWFLRDAAGKRQPLYTVDPKTKKKSSFYLILNPCLPEVRRYIGDVIEELVSNYALDGVHLDYVRYAWETTPNARNLYPRDAETLRLYRAAAGKQPDDDRRAWDGWRANQLTLLVARIRRVIDRARPGATLTAAVWSTPQAGYKDYLQNGLAWLRSGLLDAAYPMAYTDRVDAFERYVGAYHADASNRRVVPGLGVYKHQRPDQMVEQLERCRVWGGDFALFSYASLHAVATDREASPEQRAAENRLRALRRSVVRQFPG